MAHQLLDLILQKENLLEHLEFLKKYFLMSNGEFFTNFYEESYSLMQLPPTQNVENQLNNIVIPHTILKSKLEDKALIKNLSLKLKQNGFEYKDFSYLSGLNIMGNISQARNHYMRFHPMKTNKHSGKKKHCRDRACLNLPVEKSFVFYKKFFPNKEKKAFSTDYWCTPDKPCQLFFFLDMLIQFSWMPHT